MNSPSHVCRTYCRCDEMLTLCLYFFPLSQKPDAREYFPEGQSVIHIFCSGILMHDSVWKEMPRNMDN